MAKQKIVVRRKKSKKGPKIKPTIGTPSDNNYQVYIWPGVVEN